MFDAKSWCEQADQHNQLAVVDLVWPADATSTAPHSLACGIYPATTCQACLTSYQTRPEDAPEGQPEAAMAIPDDVGRRLWQVKRGDTAGEIITEDGRCVEASAGLGWMRGKTIYYLRKWVAKKGYELA